MYISMSKFAYEAWLLSVTFGVQNCSKFDQTCSNFDLAPSADHNWSKFDRLCTNLVQIFTKFEQNWTK